MVFPFFYEFYISGLKRDLYDKITYRILNSCQTTTLKITDCWNHTQQSYSKLNFGSQLHLEYFDFVIRGRRTFQFQSTDKKTHFPSDSRYLHCFLNVQQIILFHLNWSCKRFKVRFFVLGITQSLYYQPWPYLSDNRFPIHCKCSP